MADGPVVPGRRSATRRAATWTQVRRTFLVKAFQRRQEALLRHLLAAGHDAGGAAGADRRGAAGICRRTARARAAGRALSGAARRAGAGRGRTRRPSSMSGRAVRGRTLPAVPARAARVSRQHRVQRRAVPRPAGRALRRGRADEQGEPTLLDFIRRLREGRRTAQRDRPRLRRCQGMHGRDSMPKMMLHDDAAREALGRGVAQAGPGGARHAGAARA